MKPSKGWFSIVQYCPDPNRLESANIGVLLFCPEKQFLDVQMARGNQRIRRFFKGQELDLTSINFFKKGLSERLQNERERIVDHEQLLDFVDRRANEIRISPPRSIRVTEPQQQLEDLFAELVGGAMQCSTNARQQLAKSFEQHSVSEKLYKSVHVSVPIFGKQLEFPYAFQNGRFNLIRPVGFHSKDPLPTTSLYALEGESIYDTPDATYGKLKLIVVGSFRGKNDKNEEVVRRVLEKKHVTLYSMDEVDALVNEIKTTGKDIPQDSE